MKNYIIPFLSLAPLCDAELVRLSVEFDVFTSTASQVYPSVFISSSDKALFSFTYQSSDISSAMGGVYEISGEAILEIGPYYWTASNYQFAVVNGDLEGGPDSPATITDSLTFSANMAPASPFAEPLNDVVFFIQSSSSDLSFLSSSHLPDSFHPINSLAIELGDFSVRPPSGSLNQWVVNGIAGEGFAINMAIIPEPASTALLSSIPVLLFAATRRKRGNDAFKKLRNGA